MSPLHALLFGLFGLTVIIFLLTTDESTIVPNIPQAQIAPITLSLKAHDDVWAIVICDGDTVLLRLLQEGAERHWEAREGFVLSFNHSSAVELLLNGQPIAPLADTDTLIVNLQITQDNYQSFF
jgi:hypothetical protein